MGYKSIGDYYYSTNPIGKGSFSIIYKGFHITTKKKVAIKRITKYIDKKYLDSEINLMKNLNNENILQLYEVLKVKNCYYLILEYCNGGDLGEYIKSGKTEYDLNYIKQIFKGLHYLYKENVIHRDIKPNNILIHSNIIKICDFGFAKKREDNDMMNTFCGSPLYMAPEIFKLSNYTHKTDIWSLGVVIFEIIYKKHPYPSDNKNTLMSNIKNTPIYIDYLENSEIPIDLKHLLKQMLDKNEYTRINWQDIFEINIDLIKVEEPLKVDLEEDDLIFKIDDTGIKHKNIYKSTSIISSCPIRIKSQKENLYYSTIESNKVVSFLENYEDCKVYSKSAPDKTIDNYMENYIEKKPQNTENGYKIMATSPNIPNNSFYDIVNKSVNTIKYWFKY